MELWRKNLYVLWGTQFLAMTAINLVVPFLPFFIRTLGVMNEAEVSRWSGLAFAAPFLSAFFAVPLWGMLGDKYGRKPMVLRALFGLAISQALVGLSQNVFQLFFFRLLQGAISGFVASALALVSTSAPKSRVGYALGVLQSASAAGVVIGPFFGGVLADLFGYRQIFFLTAVLCGASALAVLAGVQEVKHSPNAQKEFSVFDNYRLMFTHKQLRLIALCLVMGQVSVLMAEPIFALFVESFRSNTQYMATLAGAIFSITGIFSTVSAPWWGKRNDRVGFKQGILIGMSFTGLAYIGHLFAANLVQLALTRSLLGFARGGVLPSLYSLTNLHSPPERRGGIIAIASSMTILGNMIGPVIGGYVAGHFGIRSMFVVNSLVALLVSGLIWKMMVEPAKETPAS